MHYVNPEAATLASALLDHCAVAVRRLRDLSARLDKMADVVGSHDREALSAQAMSWYVVEMGYRYEQHGSPIEAMFEDLADSQASNIVCDASELEHRGIAVYYDSTSLDGMACTLEVTLPADLFHPTVRDLEWLYDADALPQTVPARVRRLELVR